MESIYQLGRIGRIGSIGYNEALLTVDQVIVKLKAFSHSRQHFWPILPNRQHWLLSQRENCLFTMYHYGVNRVDEVQQVCQVHQLHKAPCLRIRAVFLILPSDTIHE